MLLFTRVATLTGSPRRVLPWAVEITGFVNDHCDLDVTLWSCDFGYPLGTVGWSCAADSQVTLAAETAKLLSADGYFDIVEKGEDFLGQPGQDLLRELVHGAAGEPPPIGSVATVTTATALVDRTIDAVGWSVETAQHVEKISGAQVSVLTNVYGQMGEITWIGVQPDLAGLEAARTAITGDADYLGRMAATRDLFVPASGHFAMVSRIA